MIMASPTAVTLAPPHSGLSAPPPPMHHPPPPPPPPPPGAETVKSRAQEREALRHVIAQWNANRLDLFELSEPNEDLEFHGVMRFYFQDSGQKVATKCIRVASSAPATAVVETLIEKFRPDMRMLSVPEYALYEIHENGDERRLSEDEKPLLVQLNWHKDDREGRFLLRRIDDKTNVPAVSFQEGGSSFCRKLSKREKKQLKKQEKLNKLKGPGSAGSIGSVGSGNIGNDTDGGVAEKLYTELPETSFTRSISNPEAVMRRRRQQKLERKLQQYRSKDGGPDTGGTLKIYGESLCRDVPYKTLLLSVRDTAAVVVREMLSKYGLSREDPSQYCLIQVNVLGPDNGGESSKEYHGSTNREYILDDDECPLAILMNHPSSRGSIMFHVRRRPADYHPRKRKKKPQQQVGGHKGGSCAKTGGMLGGESGMGSTGDPLEYRRYEDSYDRLPYLLELNPDGSDIVNGIPKRHRLQLNVTEVGSERSSQSSGVGGCGPGSGLGGGSQSLQLFGPNVQPRHCVVAHTEGIVTVTPCSRDAETYVNGQRIYETTILQNGAVVKFGRIHNFRFLDPSFEDRMSRHRHDSSRQGHDYSDRQSNKDESVVLGGSMSGVSGSQGNFETTFDVDGHVETVSSASSSKLQQQQDPDSRSQRSVGSREGNRSSSNYERYPQMQAPSTQRPPTGSGGGDPILPAALEFREEATDALLDALVTSLDPSAAPPHFRLAPTYALYLAARFRASTHYRPELTPTERAHRLTALLAQVAAMIRAVGQERYEDAESLAFWMANASELLHFLKSDRHISAFSVDAQDLLAEAVQIAFRNLVSCLQTDLGAVMPHFLADRDDDRNEEESAGSVLQVLASAMALLRRCRVNAALTIQLFSQLFHYVNVWAFNRIIASAIATGSTNSPHHHTHHHHPHVHQHHHRPSYCSREWGLRLGARLARVEAWAERQGLELAADCHLSRIAQSAHLLQAPKYNAEELCAISTACFKLNSLQLRALLTNYQHAPDEPRIPMELVENVIRVAENVCDDLIRNEGREVRLEEEEGELLRLPFLLPDDGYSCDVVRGLPPGLVELLTPLQRVNICRLVPQHTSAGFWTVYMTPPPSAISQHSLGLEGHQHSQLTNPPPHGHRSPSALSNRSGGLESSTSRLPSSIVGQPQGQTISAQQQQLEPETQVIKLHKSNNGMGLSIVAAKGAGQDRLGIYIKSVVKGGAADADGRLQAGDQLLKVDGQSLVGITQEKAAEYLVRTGPVVSLEVAKQGAIYHGLATLLSQPSPVMTRAHRPYSVHQDIVGSKGWSVSGTSGRQEGRGSTSHILPSASLPQLTQLQPDLPYQQKPRKSVHNIGEKSGDWHHFRSSAFSLPSLSCPIPFSPKAPFHVYLPTHDFSTSLTCLSDEAAIMYKKSTPLPHANVIPSSNVFECECFECLHQQRVELSEHLPCINNICARCCCPSINYRHNSARIGKLGPGGSFLRKRLIKKTITTKTTDRGTNTEEKDFLDDCDDDTAYSWPATDDDWEIARRGLKIPNFFTNYEDSWKIKVSDFTKGFSPENNEYTDVMVESSSSDDTITYSDDKESINEIKHINSEWHKGDEIVHDPCIYQGNGKNEVKSIHCGKTTMNSMDTSRRRSTWDQSNHGDAACIKMCCSPRGQLGKEQVASLFQHFAFLPSCRTNGICHEGALEKGSSRHASLSKSLPNLSHIECKMEEEEEHGEYGWKPGILSYGNDPEDDATEEIGYCLLYTAISTERNRKALCLLTDPLGSRSEDNLAAFDTTNEKSLESLPLICHLPWEGQKHEGTRPRRMSERDLPSKVQGEYNQSIGERGRVGSLSPSHMPAIHGSKSVPSLSSGHGDIGAVTIGPTQQTALNDVSSSAQGGIRQNLQHSQLQQHHAQQHQSTHVHSHHEVYNPGYSRTSSTNSIPQKSTGYEGGLKSRSSQNLSEPRSPGTMASQGLGSRQASNPGLTVHNPQQSLAPQQQYSPQQHSSLQQQHQHSISPQQSGEAERFYQNLSIYRSHQPESQGHNGFTPTSPNRGKLSNLQGPSDERGAQMSTKPTLRGSHSSLHRQFETGNGNQGANGARDRPVSAYIPQNGPQSIQQPVPRSQSARDVLRQEAKLQEMQEEVRRRREGRPGGPLVGASGATSIQQQYQLSNLNSHSHPQLLQQRGPNAYPQNSGHQDGVPHSPNHHHHPNPQFPASGYSPYNPQSPGYPSFSASPGQFPPQNALLQQQSASRNPPPTAPKPRSAPPASIGGGSHRQAGNESIDLPPVRPPPPEDVYRDSPPPPPPPTSTHPLYQTGVGSPGQKLPSQQNESRYNASAGEPPKGSFYPPTSTAIIGARQFTFSGTNPWDREEKEKEQAKRREAARLWRDRQISELEALGPGGRGPGQEERLRALRLEREFQRRAEEEEARRGKRGEEEDDEEEEEEDDGGRETKDGAEEGRGGNGEVKQDDGMEQPVSNGNQGEERNGNTEDARDARSVTGLLRMVANPEGADCHSSRRPLTLEVSSRSSRPSQFVHQQVPANLSQHFGQQHSTKSLQSGPLRLDNLVINGGSYAVGGLSPSGSSPRNSSHHSLHNYQDGSLPAGPYSPNLQGSMGTQHIGSGSQRLDSLLSLGPTSPATSTGTSSGLSQGAPPPPERGSSFAVMSQQQQQVHPTSNSGVLRSTISVSSANQISANKLTTSPGMASTTTTTKRVSFHDSKVVTFDDNANHQERSSLREDPNNFINEAQTILATPRSPDGSFTGNTPGVIGAQEVYRDPRTRRLAEQQKLLVNRTGPLPEKLSFKEKMKMFAMETGEDGTPKDKVKISRAQRDIEGPIPPNGGYGLN